MWYITSSRLVILKARLQDEPWQAKAVRISNFDLDTESQECCHGSCNQCILGSRVSLSAVQMRPTVIRPTWHSGTLPVMQGLTALSCLYNRGVELWHIGLNVI